MHHHESASMSSAAATSVLGHVTWPMRNQRLSLKAAAVSSTCGKLVAERTAPWSRWMPLPEMATPCSASFHHLYPGTPSCGTPGEMSPSWDTFSAGVIRDTRSAARCAAGSFALQNGSARDGDEGPHEKGGAPAAAGPASSAGTTATAARRRSAAAAPPARTAMPQF